MAEAVVGLQLRVVLGQGEELPEAGAQAALRLAQGADVVLLAGAGHGGAGGDHPLQGGLLVLHVLLAGLHQLGQFLVTLLEQHVDVRPGLAHPVLEAHQAVVERHRIGGQEDEDDDQRNTGQAHAGFSTTTRIGWRHSTGSGPASSESRSRAGPLHKMKIFRIMCRFYALHARPPHHSTQRTSP
ncbi:hypothetical protein D9M69_476820 [compost metagenome]